VIIVVIVRLTGHVHDTVRDYRETALPFRLHFPGNNFALRAAEIQNAVRAFDANVRIPVDLRRSIRGIDTRAVLVELPILLRNLNQSLSHVPLLRDKLNSRGDRVRDFVTRGEAHPRPLQLTREPQGSRCQSVMASLCP